MTGFRELAEETPFGAAEAAERMVAAVRDDPPARMDLAAQFYDSSVGGAAVRPYRRAPMAFMRWQLRRGVLGQAGAASGGSPWWRAVNETLIRDAWEAELRLRRDQHTAPTMPVARWMRFLHDPTPRAWYRAHNASIVAGYLAHRGLAAREHPVERFFMDVALVRVLYADCLLSNPRLALGRFAGAGRWLADPRYPTTDVFLSLRHILPRRYPLDGADPADLIRAENYLGHLVDYGVILPRAERLYAHAARDLGEPALLDLVRHGRPAYAWSATDGDVWTSRRSPRLRGALRELTTV